MELITLDHASFGYDDKLILKDLSFSIHENEYLCIVGENGAGKSTLLKGLLGLLNPREGEIRYENGLLPNEIGYLPQASTLQDDFPASVYEVVVSGCLNKLHHRFFYPRELKKRALVNLKRMNMLPYARVCYRNLSGGQKQRVLLARALCAGEKVLLLDEPTTGLDPLACRDFYRWIDAIHDKLGFTIIMVSHDVQDALEHCSTILHVQENGIFYGSKEEYLNTVYGMQFCKVNL